MEWDQKSIRPGESHNEFTKSTHQISTQSDQWFVSKCTENLRGVTDKRTHEHAWLFLCYISNSRIRTIKPWPEMSIVSPAYSKFNFFWLLTTCEVWKLPGAHLTNGFQVHSRNLLKIHILITYIFLSNQIIILHMPWQLDCNNMCKSVTWLDNKNQNLSEQNFELCTQNALILCAMGAWPQVIILQYISIHHPCHLWHGFCATGHLECNTYDKEVKN